MRKATITRSELRLAATIVNAIVDAPELAVELLEVARTAELVSKGWAGWEDLDEVASTEPCCGCLVGTFRMRNGKTPNPGAEWATAEGAAESAAGCAFVGALAQATGGRSREWPLDLAIRVVEDEDLDANQAA